MNQIDGKIIVYREADAGMAGYRKYIKDITHRCPNCNRISEKELYLDFYFEDEEPGHGAYHSICKECKVLRAI